MFYVVGPAVCGALARALANGGARRRHSSACGEWKRLPRRRQGARRLGGSMIGLAGGEDAAEGEWVPWEKSAARLESYTKRSLLLNSYAITENVFNSKSAREPVRRSESCANRCTVVP